MAEVCWQEGQNVQNDGRTELRRVDHGHNPKSSIKFDKKLGHIHEVLLFEAEEANDGPLANGV